MGGRKEGDGESGRQGGMRRRKGEGEMKIEAWRKKVGGRKEGDGESGREGGRDEEEEGEMKIEAWRKEEVRAAMVQNVLLGERPTEQIVYSHQIKKYTNMNFRAEIFHTYVLSKQLTTSLHYKLEAHINIYNNLLCTIIIAGNFRGVTFSWISWLVQNHYFLPHEQGMLMSD